eukprot:jgi/Ulvmu1/2490/UM137_0016.1
MLARSALVVHRASNSFDARFWNFHRDVAATATAHKHRVVFLGTPEVATIPLQHLLAAAGQPDANFEVVAVVSQPPRARGRGRKAPQPSPVHNLAVDAGLPEEAILTPAKANEASFLDAMAGLGADLCVTAAYGNMLPRRFLDLPRFGTLNIHPSLLPRYRGAAPVNRTLEAGDEVTGVSVAFTVRACDAGPVLAQQELVLRGDEQAPEVLRTLFQVGSELLVGCLPDVWSGEAERRKVPQDEAAATHAAKMSKEDAWLDFSRSALSLHNQVRGFAGWPGTCTRVRVCTPEKDDVTQDMKVLRTRLGTDEEAACLTQHAAAGGDGAAQVGPEVLVTKGGVLLPCCGGSVLVATEVQLAGKKACSAADLANGLVGKRLFLEQRAP